MFRLQLVVLPLREIVIRAPEVGFPKRANPCCLVCAIGRVPKL